MKETNRSVDKMVTKKPSGVVKKKISRMWVIRKLCQKGPIFLMNHQAAFQVM